MQELTQRVRNLADISWSVPAGLDQATHASVVGLASWQETMQSCLYLTHLAAAMYLLWHWPQLGDCEQENLEKGGNLQEPPL